MQKEVPSFARLAAMVLFSLSCFGLLTFLWVSFGGSVPLRASKYLLKANFPSATTLAQQADVRISGVNVGKVKNMQLDKGAARETVILSIDPRFAPLPADTRAILRQKTLLGETYVELTPGSRGAGKLRDGATVPNAQVEPTVSLDEILRVFDPRTKQAFRDWVAESAGAVRGSVPVDLNDALGNLAGFAQGGAGVLSVLDAQRVALRQVVHNTGVVFGALNERQGQLRDLVVNTNELFGATAREQAALAETFRVFPTFLDESRVTLARLEGFARNTRPLVDELKPVAANLTPTLRDLSGLAPNLVDLFRRLPRVIRASPRDLPQGARFLRGAVPLFAGLNVFLPELNPVLSYVNFDQNQLAAFLTNGGASAHYREADPGDHIPRYTLAQFGMINGKSLGFQQTVPNYFRGAAYPQPNNYTRALELGQPESGTCIHDDMGKQSLPAPWTGEQKDPIDDGGGNQLPPCFVQPPSLYDGLFFPNLKRGQVRLLPSPAETFAGTRSADPTVRINGG